MRDSVSADYPRVPDISFKGRCGCGQVHFKAFGQPRWVCHCHCPSCRRTTGSAFATYAGFEGEQVHLLGETLSCFKSSPDVDRYFCSACGSPVALRGTAWHGIIQLYAGLFDNPANLEPTSHIYVRERLPWIGDEQDLKLYDEIPVRDWINGKC